MKGIPVLSMSYDSERDYINDSFCLISLNYDIVIVPNALNKLFYLTFHSNPIRQVLLLATICRRVIKSKKLTTNTVV